MEIENNEIEFDRMICEECGNKLTNDPIRSENWCEKCGLVAEPQYIVDNRCKRMN